MAALGKYRTLDKAIRDTLWNEPDRWTIMEGGRVLVYDDGLELCKPTVTDRWVASRPIGYIRLSWLTHFTINAMIHRETYTGA